MTGHEPHEHHGEGTADGTAPRPTGEGVRAGARGRRRIRAGFAAAWRAGVDIAKALVHEWRADRVGGLAAEIAFFGVLSLFPAMLALAAALGSMDAVLGRSVAQPVEDQVVEFLQRVLTEQASGTVDAVRHLFDETNTGVLTIGVLLALWSASRGFVALITALNIAYDLEEHRSYVGQRFTALLLALGTVVVVSLILAILVVGPLFGTGGQIADGLGLGGAFALLWDWARWPVAAALMLLWAGTVFHLAPNHRTPWRWDLPGAVVAAAAWSVLSLGFHLYLSLAGGGNAVLGTLGGALIVLLWLYLLGMGLLLGGELNAVLVRRYDVPQAPRNEFGAVALLAGRAKRWLAARRTPPPGPAQPGGQGTDAHRGSDS